MERRHFLVLWALLFAPSLKAKTPMRPTPAQTEVPFYLVVDIPLRQNLILQSEGLVGEAIVLQGKVLGTSGNPVSGIKVETQSDGRYLFQTLYAVPYASCPPHIHVKLWRDN